MLRNKVSLSKFRLLLTSIAIIPLCNFFVFGQCKPIDVQGYEKSLIYKLNDQKGIVSDRQWDYVVLLGKEYFSAPYPAGVFETRFFARWKLVDVGSEGLLHAIVAVDEAGKSGYIFGPSTPYSKKSEKEIVTDRIKIIHLRSFNRLLRGERVNLSTRAHALQTGLLFVQVATYKLPNSQLELVSNTQDVVATYRNLGMFLKLSSEEIDSLEKLLTVPCGSEDANGNTAVFFTVDPKLNLIEKWEITVKGSKVKTVKRTLSVKIDK